MIKITDPYNIKDYLKLNEIYVYCFYDYNGRPINKIRTDWNHASYYMSHLLSNYDFEFYKVGPIYGNVDIFCYERKISLDEIIATAKSFKEINEAFKQQEVTL